MLMFIGRVSTKHILATIGIALIPIVLAHHPGSGYVR